jgi:mono/diheme cytochrome c family protein
MKWRADILPLLLVLPLFTACELRRAMYDTGRIKPYESSPFFADGRSARPLVPGTVARGDLRSDELFYTGRQAGRLVDLFPFPVDEAVMNRGQERYQIFCSVCHGISGQGDGMIVQRGFPRPTGFNDERLRKAPAGYFFDAMTNGFGRMFSYADRIEPADRWAIVAYIRALQRARDARMPDVPGDVRPDLEREGKK